MISCPIAPLRLEVVLALVTVGYRPCSISRQLRSAYCIWLDENRRNINDLRNGPLVFCPLPKLDVVGSSPIARSDIIEDQLLSKMACRSRQAILADGNG
jgi:hypothetical protein